LKARLLGLVLLSGGIVQLSGCFLEPPDSYYGAYTASCRFDRGDARSNLLDAARTTAAKLGLSLKVTFDQPENTVAVIDLPAIAGASPYRESSSGQVIFSVTVPLPELGVVVVGPLKKDPQLIATIRAAVEEELRRHGCASWKFDSTRTVYF